MLDPKHGASWLSYFQANCELESLFELYRAEAFLRNEYGPIRPAASPGVSITRVACFSRASRSEFASAARATGRSAGIVVAFRTGPATAEPFRVWLSWRCGDGELLLIDCRTRG